MHNLIIGDERWIQCTSRADTPNGNLRNNIQRTEWNAKPDRAAAPETVLECLEAAVAALIKILLPGHQAAAATIIIKTLAPVAEVRSPMRMADNCTNPGAIMTVMSAWMASRCVIAMLMSLNHDPHVKEHAYYIAVVILPVFPTEEG
jgi:hypothetical protein